ncbi:MAG: family 16 glycosylhydrolase, partial [Oscillospiraceae bacterium]|nr:family 16 glycosylhydrolase [Oscillospiraceae bacterium]
MTKSTKIKKFLAILLAIVLMASIIAPTASALPETDELTPTIENEIYVVEQEGALVFGENAFNDGNDINNEFEPSDDGFVYDVRPVARPVAGHFPTGFYRLFLRPNGSAGYVLEHNYGYYQSIEWYPAVPRAFLPNQAYTAIVTLEPHLTSLPEGGNGWWSVVFCDDPECENPHDAGDRVPPHNMDDPRGWALRPGVLNQYGVERPVWPPNFTSCTTTKPATFTGTTLEQLEGLPTDGVANIEIEEAGNNLVITIEFEPTGAVQPAIVTFFDDFSGEYNPYDRHGGITTHFARATDRMWRQHMSYWSMDNANIEVRDGNHILVLSNELIRETVDDYQAYINDLLLDYSWINPNARERENALRSGAVRTISHDWYEIYFEQSFGYWEARIQLPKERGMWGAFWLMNRYQGTNVNFHQGAAARQGRTGAELDIVEAIISSAANYNNSQFNSAFHWNGWGGMVDGVWQGSRSFSMGSNRNAAHGFDIFDGNWHTFSMEWTPTSYTMFINGVEYGRHEFGMGSGNRAVHQISHNPTYIKLSTEAGGASSTPAAWPLGAGMHFCDDFFSEMLVDYVRVWNGPRPESSAFATPATLVDVEVTGNAVPNLYLDAYAVSNPPGQPLSPNATYQWQHGPTPDGPWTNVPNRPLGTGQVAGPNRQTNHIPSAVTTNRRLYLVEQDMDNLSNFIRVVVTHAGDSLNSEAIPFREVAEELDIAIRGVPAVAQSLTADVYPVTHAHTFRWQLSPDGGETWNNVTGAAGASPTILLTAPHHNQLARIA